MDATQGAVGSENGSVRQVNGIRKVAKVNDSLTLRDATDGSISKF